MDKVTFRQGQWLVTLERHEGEPKRWGKKEDDYVEIDVVGRRYNTQGILKSRNEPMCAYYEPEIIPYSLDDEIYRRAKEMLIIASRERRKEYSKERLIQRSFTALLNGKEYNIGFRIEHHFDVNISQRNVVNYN